MKRTYDALDDELDTTLSRIERGSRAAIMAGEKRWLARIVEEWTVFRDRLVSWKNWIHS
jgi:hypothetical protein